MHQTQNDPQPKLVRRMGLPLLTLYGLSVTVGAGIYVLIGEAAARAGPQAPFAFLLASALVALSAASYAELSARFPVSAGEAAYVHAGLRWPSLAFVVGLMVCASGVVSSATLLTGSVGYVRGLISLPDWGVMLTFGCLIGGIAAWGIGQTAWTAAALAVVEVGLLVAIAVVGLSDTHAISMAWSNALAAPQSGALFGLSSAVLIAFFAFIGFEDMVNVAEEVREPEKTLPRAIALTLAITTVLYFVVMLVSLSKLSVSELANSNAPLSHVFERLFGGDGRLVGLIAIAAVLNGMLVQVVMASRVIYGLSRMGQLPSALGEVNSVTRTPVAATGLVVVAVLVLSFGSQTSFLADLTSTITLLVFAAVNLSLWRLKSRAEAAPVAFSVPVWIPIVGFFVSLAFVGIEWANRLG